MIRRAPGRRPGGRLHPRRWPSPRPPLRRAARSWPARRKFRRRGFPRARPRCRCGRPVAAARLVVVGFGLQALLLGDQPFAVGDRDLEVVGMDFREGQEAVAVAAILDERRLQRRLDADDLGEVDVALQGLAGRGLEIEFGRAWFHQPRPPGSLRGGWHRSACGGPWRAPRGVGTRTGASDRRPCRLSGARGTVRFDPPNGQLWPRRGSIAPPDHDCGPADLGVPIATACLTVPPQARRSHHSVGAPARLRRLPSERTIPKEGASNDGDCSRNATYGVRGARQTKRLKS